MMNVLGAAEKKAVIKAMERIRQYIVNNGA
jgi:hypothetical protein